MTTGTPPRLDSVVTQARNHLLVNLLVLPGLGSLLARRKAGWLQMLAALAGFALTTRWFIAFVVACVSQGEIPIDDGPHLRMGLLGVGLFGLAWGWALATGLSIVRRARRE